MDEFIEFPKIARLSRDIIITEKIDGTNAQVAISDDGTQIRAGSRSRWLEPGKQDNFGFAGWVEEHKEELLKLGPGRHYGEWWGAGIQRRYGTGEKRFSLFNVSRWAKERPMFCHLVPVLYQGPFVWQAIEDALADLRENGSKASPNFKPAEGIVIYHTASGHLYKKTLEKDEKPKGSRE